MKYLSLLFVLCIAFTTSPKTSAFDDSAPLQRGFFGESVAQLQKLFVAEGTLSPEHVTGFFGDLTEKALQEFQEKYSIFEGSSPIDGKGIAGPKTFALITALRSAKSAVLGASTSSANAEKRVWIMANNLGGAPDLLPKDGKDIFLKPNQWANARASTGVYFFIPHTIDVAASSTFTDSYIEDHVIPVLKSDDVTIGLEVWGSLWAQCTFKYGENKGKTLGEVRRAQEKKLIDRIERLGGNVSHITMLSTMSKLAPKGAYDNCDAYEKMDSASVKKRLEDIVSYTKFIRENYPDMQVGELDSLIRFKEWQDGQGYTLAKKAFDDANEEDPSVNHYLDYWVIDLPYEQFSVLGVVTYQHLKKSEDLIRTLLNADFVLVAASQYAKGDSSTESGDIQAQKSHLELNKFLNLVHHAGVRPDYYYNNLYFPEPRYALPDNDVNKYTQMRQVFMIGEWVKKHRTFAKSTDSDDDSGSNTNTLKEVVTGLTKHLSRTISATPTLDDGVTVKTYEYKKTDSNEPLHIIAHMPDASKSASAPLLPAVVLFHGGGHNAGDPVKYFADLAPRIASNKVVVFSVQYRLKSLNTSGTSRLDSTKDAMSAMRWITEHADDFGVDPNQIAAVGTSAGGQLALMTALRSSDSATDTLYDEVGDSEDFSVTGVSAFYPQTKYTGSDLVSSPLTYLENIIAQGDRVSVPISIHLGTADVNSTINPHAPGFCSYLSAKQGLCDLDYTQSAPHNFLSPASIHYEAGLALLENDLEDFFDRELTLSNQNPFKLTSIERKNEFSAWKAFICGKTAYTNSLFCKPS